MLANGPPLFVSGVLESIFSSAAVDEGAAVDEAGSSGGVVTGLDFMQTCPCILHPYTPLLYRRIGVYRGIHHCLILALKQRLLVLVTSTHNLCFEQK